MAQYVGDALRRNPRIVLAPPQVGEVTRYVAKLEKARSLLGYAPCVQLPDGIVRAVAWHRQTGRLPDGPGEPIAAQTPTARP
jgi:nucleoside-diphosphate-sugar epimerase